MLHHPFLFIISFSFILASCGGETGGKEQSENINETSPPATLEETFIQYSYQELILSSGQVKQVSILTNSAAPISYTSEDEHIAFIDHNGLITGKTIGTTTISASTTVNGKTYSASLKLIIEGIRPEINFIKGSGDKDLTCGEEFNNQSRTSEDIKLYYSSSNPEVASVNEDGVVTLLSAGKADIISFNLQSDIYSQAESFYSINIHKAPQSIEFEQPVYEVFYNQVIPALKFTESGPGAISYSSSSPNAISVNADGSINIKRQATATIHAAKIGDDCYQMASSNYELRVLKQQRNLLFAQKEVQVDYGKQPDNELTIEGNATPTLSTSNPSVASYNTSNTLVIHRAGSTEIIASLPETEFHESAEAHYTLKINKAEQSPFAINSPPSSMRFGDEHKFYTRGGSGSGRVIFSSDNPNALEISPSGVARLNNSSSHLVTIRAEKLGDDRYKSSKFATHTITTKKALQKLTVFGDKAQSMKFNDRKQLSSKVMLGNGKLTYHSQNPSIVSINALGVMRAERPGTSFISISLSETAQYEKLSKSIAIHVGKSDQFIIGNEERIFLKINDSTTNNLVRCLNTSECNIDEPIHYTSSDPQVVSVDSNGNLQPINIGTATITAHKQGDHFYNSASHQYNVNIIPDEVTVNAQIGYEKSVFQFPSYLSGTTFTASNRKDCIHPSSNNCTQHTTQAVISDSFISTPKITSKDAGYIHLDLNNSPTIAVKSDQGYSSRDSSAKIWFKNKFWIIGGINDEGLLNDIWSSSDGIAWKLEVSEGPFLPRLKHQLISYKDSSDNKEKLWLIGGHIESEGYSAPYFLESVNDVWSSENGINWTQVTAEAPFSPRGGFKAMIFRNKLTIFSGESRAPYTNINFLYDSWSSTNGKEWQRESTYMPASSSFDIEFFKSPTWGSPKLWMLSTFKNNSTRGIWSSGGGHHWFKEITTNDGLHDSVGYNSGTNLIKFKSALDTSEKLWVFGSSTWSSDNGIDDWKKRSQDRQPVGKVFKRPSANGDKLWLFYENKIAGNRTYNSEDGVNWEYQNQSHLPEPRFLFASTSISNRYTDYKRMMYIHGGININRKNDSWRFNGDQWEIVTKRTGYHNYQEHTIKEIKDPYSQNNSLWLFGGRKNAFQNKELLRSSSGKSWDKVHQFDDISVYSSIQVSDIFNDSGDADFLMAIISETRKNNQSNGRIEISSNGREWKQVSPNIAINLIGDVSLIRPPDGYTGILIHDADGIMHQSFNGEDWSIVDSNFPKGGHLFRHTDIKDNIEKLWKITPQGVWTSLEGVSWNKVSNKNELPPHSSPPVSMGNYLVSLVISPNSGIADKIWYSDDGIFWYMKQEITIP